MTESVQVAAIVIFAILVGALIPVLVSLRSLMKRAEHAIGTVEGRADELLDRTNTIMRRVDTLTGELEGGSTSVHNVIVVLNDLTESLKHARKTLQLVTAVAASVGPAVAAIVQSMRNGDGATPGGGEGDGSFEPDFESVGTAPGPEAHAEARVPPQR